MLRYIISIILFLSCVGHLSAQFQENFIFSHLDRHDGVASDDVRGVQQDKKGYIWIATLNGLQRYDGQRFITFRHNLKDPHSLPSNRIYNLRMDQQEKLWVHCGDNKVGYMNITDFTFHEVPVNYAPDILKKTGANLFVGSDGNVMLILLSNTILTYNEAANEFSEKYNPFSLPKNWHANFITQEKKQKNLWIACDSGLVKYNPVTSKISYPGHNTDKDEVIAAYAGFNFISHPYFDNSGRFWLERWTVEGGGPFLHCYDTVSNKRTDWNTRAEITKGYHEISNIQEDDKGTIWIVGPNIMAHLSRSATDFENIPNNLPGEFSIRYDAVRTIFQDKEKNIWACTDKGLYRFNPSAQLFKIVPNQRVGDDSLYGPDVTDILQTSNGDILVGTWGNGIFTYNSDVTPKNISFLKPTAQQGEDLPWALLQRRNGDIWRACQGGFIFITDASTKKTIRIRPTVFEGATIRQVIEDKNGNIWLGSHRGHLVKWIASSNTFQLIHKATTVYRLYIDDKETLWVCSGSDGAYRINVDNDRIIAQFTATGPEGKRLMSIGAADIVQHNDSLYVIASEGLNILNIKTGRITFFGEENGLPANSVDNIIQDKLGYLWVTAEGRLCRININGFVVSIFNEEDGLAPNTFNYGSANMLNDGRIAIGRAHDFIIFDPANMIHGDMVLPKPEITAFALMNQWLPMDSLQKLREIDLRYNQNSVTIEFSTLTYLNHFPVMYMLKGLDKNWLVASNTTEAIYNYLPPGDYTFMIKCANGEGGFSETTTLKITVRAPFWQTWWFYCLLALLVAILFYWLDRERSRRKESMQRMRGNIAGNLHEEINIALNNINVLSEIARIKADKEPEQSKNYINEIHHKSHNMIIAMDDMLWSIDPANDKMSKTIDRIREFTDALRSRYNVSVDLQTDDKIASLNPDMKIRYELLLICKLALRLLVEELGAKETLIHLGYVKSQLQMNIFSMGIRLNDGNNITIKAMEEIKSKANAIDASIEFQRDEKGTAIILAVKTN